MKNLFVILLDKLQESFWLLPVLMLIAAGGLAAGTLSLDHAGIRPPLDEIAWMLKNGPQGSRSVLTAIAGSMITVAGVVFSITVVVLTLASSQYGPRMIRNFMRDRMNQFAVGTFVATFTFCILVLGAIEDLGENSFVPHLSVNIGVAMAVGSLLVLIYYLHHVAASIRPEVLIESVNRELLASIGAYAESCTAAGRTADGTEADTSGYKAHVPISANCSGYIQAIDYARLASAAAAASGFIRLDIKAGHFVFENAPIGRLSSNETALGEHQRTLESAILIGNEPTATQDLEYAIRQLVEIAVRALSPGVNDPFTAMSCIDYLCAGVAKLAGTDLKGTLAVDVDDTPRLLAPSFGFEDVSDAAFLQLRQYAHRNVDVIIRLIERMGDLYRSVDDDGHRRHLRMHAELAAGSVLAHTDNDYDRDAIEERLAQFTDA